MILLQILPLFLKNKTVRILELIFHLLKNLLSWITEKTFLTVHEIDPEKGTAIISRRGSNSTVKMNFDQIARDMAILTNIPPVAAAWIGYNHGINGMPRSSRKNSFGEKFSLGPGRGDYRLSFLDRNGNVGFIKLLTGETKFLPIRSILSDSELLSHFCPVEAYYLGLWYSIHSLKIRNQHKNQSSENIVILKKKYQ